MTTSRFDDLTNLQAGSWATAGIRDRIADLQRLENRLADDQNRPRAVVIDFAGPAHNVGRLDVYNPKVMEINRLAIESDNPIAAVKAVIHEGRHAYQADCVANPVKHSEVSKEQVSAWSHNLTVGNYIPSDVNPRAYWQQPVEVDARAYTRVVVNEIYHGRAADLEVLYKSHYSTNSQNLGPASDKELREASSPDFLANWKLAEGAPIPVFPLEAEKDRLRKTVQVIAEPQRAAEAGTAPLFPLEAEKARLREGWTSRQVLEADRTAVSPEAQGRAEALEAEKARLRREVMEGLQRQHERGGRDGRN